MSLLQLRTAIKERLDGTLTTPIRAMTSGVLVHGAWAGQDEAQKRALVVQGSSALTQSQAPRGYFDVLLADVETSPSSPMSALSNTRLATIHVDIPVYFAIPAKAEVASHNFWLKSHALDILDAAAQALHYPGSITQTAASASTSVVSGMMFGDPALEMAPVYSEVSYDYEAQIAEYKLDAYCCMQITQATS